MKLSPAHLIFCYTLLILWASQSETEANQPDVCQDEIPIDDIQVHSSSPQVDVDDGNYIEENENFSCFLDPTNILNCSWSFHALQEDAQLSVYIGICDSNITVHPLRLLSEDRVGSESMVLGDYEKLHVTLHFNVSLHNTWIAYFYAYDTDMLEVLSPPQNIAASVKDGQLLVEWGEPLSRKNINLQCIEYQLDMGDQEKPKDLSEQLSYTEPNADPTYTYRVRVRARVMSVCSGSPQWSEWSHIVKVEQSVYKLSTLVIISISLGIPMILLAVLLLVRHQRVSKVLFPPIPRPPPKYMYFLEKNDTFNFFHPVPSAKPEEEITEVEDAEQNPGKTI